MRKRAPKKQRAETEKSPISTFFKSTERVSRNSREEKRAKNFGGDFSTFGPMR